MSTPARTVERRRATSCAPPASANASAVAEAVDLAARRAAAAARARELGDRSAYTGAERVAMADLIAERLLHASTVDGATAVPLWNEEARNLAAAVVALIEECKAATR